MNSQVCVQCNNIKIINSTDNRLVTESCGHVKCMDCLVHEKSGCVACLEEQDSNVEYKSNGVTVNHVNSVMPYPYEVPVEVIVVSANKNNETSHIVSGEDDKGQYYFCKKCDKKCRSRRQLAYHAYCDGLSKPFHCAISTCDKSFVTRSHFKYHMRVHRNEKMYACDICKDKFIAKSKLTRHMLTHTKEKNYVCSVSLCKKAFNNMSSLKQHILIHTKEKPHNCHKCGAQFRDRSNYYKHFAKHDEKKRSLIKNNRVDQQKKVLQCPRCPQIFHSGKDMRRHSAVHLDSKPFGCKICPHKSFRRKDNLERHIRNTHPECTTSAAIEVDEVALAERASLAQKATNDIIRLPSPNTSEKDREYLVKEKTRLETLNPLPPLSQEIIEKHLRDSDQAVSDSNEVLNATHEGPFIHEALDKAYILEANNARESVIVAKSQNNCLSTTKDGNDREPPKDVAYVHKIRKAHTIPTRGDVPLPPVKESKLMELVLWEEEVKNTTNRLDVAPPPKNVELLKKILYDKPENNATPKHWRKLKLNVTCSNDD